MAAGRLVILSGPSAVGKDSVIDRWKELDPSVERIVARTTRDPRPGEVDGRDYVFLTVEQFRKLIDEDFFLEYKPVFDNFYGTPRTLMDRALEEGRIAVLKIDVQGALDVMKLRPDAITVFLMPPSEEALRDRINLRDLDSPEVKKKRLAKAVEEMSHAGEYQHQIVNDVVDLAVQKLRELTSE
ncbi:MAG: guanylate kinase [Fimbriimonas sp.]|nr:guanylate kinase [Fimbriimonas sp.]